jgi:hypothetical protein
MAIPRLRVGLNKRMELPPGESEKVLDMQDLKSV